MLAVRKASVTLVHNHSRASDLRLTWLCETMHDLIESLSGIPQAKWNPSPYERIHQCQLSMAIQYASAPFQMCNYKAIIGMPVSRNEVDNK